MILILRARAKIKSAPHPPLRGTFSRKREKGMPEVHDSLPRVRGKMPRSGRREPLWILSLIIRITFSRKRETAKAGMIAPSSTARAAT